MEKIAKKCKYNVAEIIARNMQPIAIAETLILPACKEIVKCYFLGKAAKREISICTFVENYFLQHTCPLASRNKQLKNYMMVKKCHFNWMSQQTSQKCHLLSYIRYLDGDSVVEQFLS